MILSPNAAACRNAPISAENSWALRACNRLPPFWLYVHRGTGPPKRAPHPLALSAQYL
jgi:hypothetical protein